VDDAPAIELDATPVLETERLVLRIPETADTADFAVAMSDAEVMRFVGRGSVASYDDAAAAIERFRRHWLMDGFGVFAVVRRSDGRVIGRASLLAWDPVTWEHSTRAEIGEQTEIELGWVFARHAWGQGYATEAAIAARDWVVEAQQPRRLISIINPQNEASKRVAAKIGERYERDIVRPPGYVAELWST
jgi:RimJ/RimL family protein N-acetyltransferase